MAYLRMECKFIVFIVSMILGVLWPERQNSFAVTWQYPAQRLVSTVTFIERLTTIIMRKTLRYWY
jgi:hypothetical protein